MTVAMLHKQAAVCFEDVELMNKEPPRIKFETFETPALANLENSPWDMVPLNPNELKRPHRDGALNLVTSSGNQYASYISATKSDRTCAFNLRLVIFAAQAL
jgi:hypothetical protein